MCCYSIYMVMLSFSHFFLSECMTKSWVPRMIQIYFIEWILLKHYSFLYNPHMIGTPSKFSEYYTRKKKLRRESTVENSSFVFFHFIFSSFFASIRVPNIINLWAVGLGFDYFKANQQYVCTETTAAVAMHLHLDFLSYPNQICCTIRLIWNLSSMGIGSQI